MSQKFLQSEKLNLLNCIGTEHCWGWSPAIDMLSVVPDNIVHELKKIETISSCYKEKIVNSSNNYDNEWMDFLEGRASIKDTVNNSFFSSNDIHLLLCGASDIRHILKTLSSAASKSCQQEPSLRDLFPTIHFSIYEPNLRIHARHLFFIQWLWDSLFSLSELEDRVSIFLEIFANSQIRDISAAHVKDTSTKALKTCSNNGTLASMIDFSEMKSKEKDFLENQLKYWTSDAGNDPCICEIWEKRLRNDMAERYDNKDNIIDWDFNFFVMEKTNAIKFQEYRLWRNKGIAYDYAHINPRKGVSYDYTVPNKTLCHFLRPVKNISKGVYYGDIKNGPFYSFGVDTENEHLKKRNFEGQLKYGNGVIALHNVRAWIYQLLTGKEWSWADHALAWDDPKLYNYLPPDCDADEGVKSKFPKTKFHFIGLDLERMLFHMANNINANNFGGESTKFDVAFFSCSCIQFMTSALFNSMKKDHGIIIVETLKYVCDASDEAYESFNKKVKQMCVEAGFMFNESLTDEFHKNLPPLKKRDLPSSDSQKRSDYRYLSPHVLAFGSKKT